MDEMDNKRTEELLNADANIDAEYEDVAATLEAEPIVESESEIAEDPLKANEKPNKAKKAKEPKVEQPKKQPDEATKKKRVSSFGLGERANGGIPAKTKKIVMAIIAVILILALSIPISVKFIIDARDKNLPITTISFDGNESDRGSQASIEIKYSKALPKLNVGFTREDFNFLGYFDAKDGGARYYDSKGESVVKKWNKKDKAVTLYAHWERDGEYYTKGLIFERIPAANGKYGYRVSVGTAKNETEIVIPNIYRGEYVVEISNDFRCPNLTSITLPFVGKSQAAEGVDSLFGYIFGSLQYTGGTKTEQYYGSANDGRRNYYIPTTLTTVVVHGARQRNESLSYAFTFCEGLTSVTLPSGAKSVGDYAFENCIGLTSVALPTGLLEIGKGAFTRCYNLVSVNIPASVTVIDEAAFHWCAALKSINIPQGVTTLARSVFYECGSLERIDYSYRAIRRIEDNAFYNCVSLKSITVAQDIAYLGNGVFSGWREDQGQKIYMEGRSQSAINNFANSWNSGCDERIIEWNWR